MANVATEPRIEDAERHRADFIEQMRSVPGAVALICAADGADRTGMAATAWNSLCADPPMLLVCVNRNASVHAMISRSGKFSVNLLATGDSETVAIFSAQRGLTGSNRFIRDKWRAGPGGQPMLSDAVAAFECQLEASHTYGTHEIFIGKVRHVGRGTGEHPLIYLNGRYWAPSSLDTDG